MTRRLSLLALALTILTLPLVASESSAQRGRRDDQAHLGPGLYLFQNRLTNATCDDIDGEGYVYSYVAEVNGIPGAGSMQMRLPSSQYWPRWDLRISDDGHVIGSARQAGISGPRQGSSHFDVTRTGDQFTGRGSRTYSSRAGGQDRRCTIEFDALLRRVDR